MSVARMKEELRAMVKAAVSDGPVKLSSGAFSDFYIDGRQVTLKPRGAFLLANVISDIVADLPFDAVGGPTMGADPIVGALCYHLGLIEGQTATGFIIRKESKQHGLARRIEGPDLSAGARVVIVEDIVTSAGSVLKGIKAVEEAGARVVKVIAIVDREAGGREALTGAGYDYQPIFTRSELK